MIKREMGWQCGALGSSAGGVCIVSDVSAPLLCRSRNNSSGSLLLLILILAPTGREMMERSKNRPAGQVRLVDTRRQRYMLLPKPHDHILPSLLAGRVYYNE